MMNPYYILPGFTAAEERQPPANTPIVCQKLFDIYYTERVLTWRRGEALLVRTNYAWIEASSLHLEMLPLNPLGDSYRIGRGGDYLSFLEQKYSSHPYFLALEKIRTLKFLFERGSPSLELLDLLLSLAKT